MKKKYLRHPNTSCTVCLKEIYRRPVEIDRGPVFCSLTCYGRYNRKETPCVVCGQKILARANKKTCSRKCANVNRRGISYKVGRPKDKVLDQRAIKRRVIAAFGPRCQRCKYDKVEILHIHHRDRNRSNNELSNLELICPNCHYEEHYLDKSWLKNKK